MSRQGAIYKMGITISEGAVQELDHVSELVLDVIRKRRTIRHFTDEDINKEQVETLMEIAMCAPNRLDRRPWHFVIIRNKELQKQLADLLRVHPYLEVAPVVIAVCGLPKVSPTWIMDVAAATENMVLAATAIGLGATWVGSPDTTLWDRCEEILFDALAIPGDNVRIPALVAVGHPAQELPPHGRHDRFDRARVHYGSWGIQEPK
jgi:nitroreductase